MGPRLAVHTEPTLWYPAEIKVSREFELPPVPAAPVAESKTAVANEAGASKLVPALTMVEPAQPQPAPAAPIPAPAATATVSSADDASRCESHYGRPPMNRGRSGHASQAST